jgi:hypothetical protein
MLLCLDREQRIVLLLGKILETDTVGAELLDISKDNFRQRLCRAREQLSSFMGGRCGLTNAANPCRCARKTSAFIRDGIVDPKRLQFTQGHLDSASFEAPNCSQALRRTLVQSQDALRALYPVFDAPDAAERLSSLLSRPELRAALKLNEGN